LIWFIWFILFVWLNEFNQTDQTNKTKHPFSPATVCRAGGFFQHPAAFVYHNHLQSNNLDRRGTFP